MPLQRLPSLQKSYDDCFTGDPAFRQPPKPPELPADEQAIEAFKKAYEAYRAEVDLARDRGDWSHLREGDLEPTVFTLKPLSTDQYTVIRSLHQESKPELSAILAFRTALVSVQNLAEGTKVTREKHDLLGAIAKTDFFDKAEVSPKLAFTVMEELGGNVLVKAARIDPK